MKYACMSPIMRSANSVEKMQVFCAWLGSLAGDAAIAVGARSVYLAGGISTHVQDFLADGRFLVPAYLGTRGWLAYDLSGRLGGPVDWSEVHELIDSSHRATAGKRLIAQLDAR